jgi:four helix bundle protein
MLAKRGGSPVAPAPGMSAPADLRDIAAWQLAHLLNLRVDLFLLSPDFKRHYRRVEQLGDAVRSGPRNIAEGFARDRGTFADRLRLARGSEAQVLNHLTAAYDQRLITLDELQIAERLTRRAMRAANGLIRQLEAADRPSATPRATRRTRPRKRASPTD